MFYGYGIVTRNKVIKKLIGEVIPIHIKVFLL